jgi:hypothetical protein
MVANSDPSEEENSDKIDPVQEVRSCHMVNKEEAIHARVSTSVEHLTMKKELSKLTTHCKREQGTATRVHNFTWENSEQPGSKSRENATDLPDQDGSQGPS